MRHSDLVADIEAVDEDAVPAIKEAQGDDLIAQHVDLVVTRVCTNEAQKSIHFNDRSFDDLEEVATREGEYARQVVASVEYLGKTEDLSQIGWGHTRQHTAGIGNAAQFHVLDCYFHQAPPMLAFVKQYSGT